jgi:hypothetical protein
MQQLEEKRGGISSHFSHLKREHDLPVSQDANGFLRFDRRHLGISDHTRGGGIGPSREEIVSVPPSPTAQDLADAAAARVTTTVLRIVRDTRLANWVKAQHKYRCQICGTAIKLADGSTYAEGHHLQPLGAPHSGPDTVDNIVCLCPNHHAACDLGAIRLTLEELLSADGHVVSMRFIDYHNRVMYQGN